MMKVIQKHKKIIIFLCVGIVSSVVLLYLDMNSILGNLVAKSLGLFIAYFMLRISIVYGLETLKSNKGYNRVNKNKSIKKYNKEYLKTVGLFKYGIQNRCLSRDDILDIKDKINGIVGKYDGFKPKNDAHEIYTKLKDNKISEEQMRNIRDFIFIKLKI